MLKTGPPFYEVIQATQKSSRAKAVPSFLSYFKSLSISPVLAMGIELSTSPQSSFLPTELALVSLQLSVLNPDLTSSHKLTQ